MTAFPSSAIFHALTPFNKQFNRLCPLLDPMLLLIQTPQFSSILRPHKSREITS